ncbi:transmembrane protein, putative (macronuclear) [Tetrahymena thermophila SB210]|uniref:Transmembrane protein, putative n=1 Tax=Tetrahymena thermophila (strain SB210) TaxID=312017 RepID=W7X1M2_TETTS|nr:transmembrane protein, putative [Tetrahymena thermophila SB210]EWS73140.1 transmembrane protein, putative [Tetrahymena thermophila SB210]|eukprot:XP_012654327.1 transmembrane protein, putative [Tetrahymena thermophila SB210]
MNIDKLQATIQTFCGLIDKDLTIQKNCKIVMIKYHIHLIQNILQQGGQINLLFFSQQIKKLKQLFIMNILTQLINISMNTYIMIINLRQFLLNMVEIMKDLHTIIYVQFYQKNKMMAFIMKFQSQKHILCLTQNFQKILIKIYTYL